ncbi:MAG: TauD/TfdA family dioxygenase [Vicinamibacterales bacterium]
MDYPDTGDVDVTRPQAIRRKPIRANHEALVTERALRQDGPLPLLMQPAVDGVNLTEWAALQQEPVRQKLLAHGAILFRGFNVAGIAEFEGFMQALAGDLLDYSYRSTPRSQVSGKVYSSTEYPAHQTIPQHNEMSYTRRWPMLLGFFCVEPSAEGGETPIADSHAVFQQVDPAIRDRFASKSVMYVRNYGDALDLPWQEVFQTDDRAAAEAFCRQAGIEFEWKGEDRLRTSQVCQAVAAHPVTGQMVWFNQAHLFHVSSLGAEMRDALLGAGGDEPPRNAYYGDGSPIDERDLDQIREAYDKETIVFPWQKGDILLVDNMLVSHGRRPYRGSRKIVVAMAQACSSQAD